MGVEQQSPLVNFNTFDKAANNDRNLQLLALTKSTFVINVTENCPNTKNEVNNHTLLTVKITEENVFNIYCQQSPWLYQQPCRDNTALGVSSTRTFTDWME